MITTRPKPGDEYIYLLKAHPAIISASSIAPKPMTIIVTAVDDKDVWYRINDRKLTHQTPIDRFMEIVNPKDEGPKSRGYPTARSTSIFDQAMSRVRGSSLV